MSPNIRQVICILKSFYVGIYIIYVVQSPLMCICITEHSSANRSIAAHGVSSHELPGGFSLYWSSCDKKKKAVKKIYISDASQSRLRPVKASLAVWKHMDTHGKTWSSLLLSHLRSALCMSMPALCKEAAEIVLHVHQSPLNSLIWGPHCYPHASSNTLPALQFPPP